MKIFDRFKAKDASVEMDLLKKEVDLLKRQLDDVVTEDTLDLAIRAMEGSTKDAGIDLFSGGTTTSNVHGGSIQQDVDHATLHRLFASEGWFYIVVNALAQTIAALPILLEKKQLTTQRSNPDDPNSPVVQREQWVDASGESEQLLFKFPNPIQPAFEFYYLLLVDLLATGDAYIYLDSDDLIRPGQKTDRKVKGMYRVNSSMVQPVRASKSMHVEAYDYHCPEGSFRFSLDEMIHIRLPNPIDAFVGLAPVVPVYKNVLLDRFTSEHMIRFYKQGARLGGVIKTTRKLTKDQMTRLQRSFDQDYTGKLNHHKTLILPEGMDYDSIEQNPGETSLIEFNKNNREPILSAYRVPPVVVGLLDGATYANANIQEKTYYLNTVIPLSTLIMQALNAHRILLPASRNLRAKHDFSNVEALRENENEKSTTAKGKLETGWTINEIRQKVWNLPPLKGGDISPVLEKLKNPSPIFGMSAPAGDGEKDESGNPVAGETLLPASLSGPQVTAVMNILGRVSRGRIKPEAAVEMLVSVFAIPRDLAMRLVGLKPQAPTPPTDPTPPGPSTPAPTDDGKTTNPDQQPDNQVISDVIPTDVTFEQRVAQLVAIAIDRGLTPEQAATWAIERALQEGFKPTMPETTVTEEGKEDVSHPETRPVAVGGAVVVDPEEEEGKKKPKLCPLSKEELVAYAKDVTGDGVQALMDQRKEEVLGFFKRLGELFMKQHAKNIKNHGIHYFTKAEEEEVIDEDLLKDFIEVESGKLSPAMLAALGYGYDKTLVDVRMDVPDERAKRMLEKYGARNIRHVTDTTKRDIRKILVDAAEESVGAGEISARIREYFDGTQTAARAQTITRTETLSAVSLGQDLKTQEFKKEFPDQAKKLRKVWISSRDDRVRGNPNGQYADSEADHYVLDGEVVDEDQEFSNGLQYPRDPDSKSAAEIINCRCAHLVFLEQDEDDMTEILDEGSPMEDVKIMYQGKEIPLGWITALLRDGKGDEVDVKAGKITREAFGFVKKAPEGKSCGECLSFDAKRGTCRKFVNLQFRHHTHFKLQSKVTKSSGCKAHWPRKT